MEMSRGEAARRALVVLVACSVAAMAHAAETMRGVDLRNFSYPFVERESPPNAVRWMPKSPAPRVGAVDGRRVFVSKKCEDQTDCPLLTLDKVQHVRLAAIQGDAAPVVATYHTGGSATWQYVYVVDNLAGAPEVLAWLETGSRAEQGLRKVAVERGDLVVTVSDPAKRQGDCCSSGAIVTRYRWRGASFKQTGPRVGKGVAKAPGGNLR